MKKFLISYVFLSLLFSCSNIKWIQDPITDYPHRVSVVSIPYEYEKEKEKEEQTDAILHYTLAQMNMREGDYAKAEEEFQKVITSDPQPFLPKLELASIKARLGKKEEAGQILKQSEEIASSPLHFLQIGQIWHTMNNNEELLETLKRGLEKFPSDEALFSNLYGTLVGMNRKEEAKEIAEKFIKNSPNSFVGHFHLSAILSELGEKDRAKEQLEYAIKLQPDDPTAVLRLGEIYEKEGDWEDAIRIYNNALSISPDFHTVRLKLVEIYKKIKDYSKALENISIIAENIPSPEVYLSKVLLLASAKRFEEALSLLDTVEKDFEEEKDKVTLMRGLIYKDLKKYEEAISEFKKINPPSELYDDSVAQEILCMKEINVEEALKYGMSITEKVSSQEVLESLSWVLREKEDYKKAIDMIDFAIATFGEKESLLYTKSTLLYEDSFTEESIMLIKKLLNMDENNPDYMNFLGYIWAENGQNLDEAESLIRKAMKLKPKEAYIIDSMGWVLFMKNEFEESEKWIREAYEMESDDPVISEHWGDVLSKKGEKQEALKIYKEALKKKPKKRDRIRIENKLNNLEKEMRVKKIK